MGRARIHASDADRRAAQDYRRKETRKAHNLNFIMVDGEGIGDGKEHRYVLLGVGNSQIENPDGLSFAQIMEHLYSSFLLSPDSVFSGYYLGYDFAQWLRKLPRERAGMLLSDSGIAKRVRRRSGPNKTPFPVRYQGWEFDLLAMKRFKLRPELGGKWMYICDAGSFFQTSFLGAIDPAKWSEPIVTESEFALLSEGKARRSVAALDDEMRYYNRLENEVGSRLLRATNQGFTHAGIRLKRDQWFGPGQAAQEWVRKTECPKAEDLKHRREMLDVARRTYYGGWFEICAHGICPGTSYEYDINSAYPAIIARLPCLLHGDWREGIHNGYTICHAIVRGSDKYLGAMLHRLADGNIRRPNETRGWYWQSEIDAAIRAGLIDTVDVEEAYTYVPCDSGHPSGELPVCMMRG